MKLSQKKKFQWNYLALSFAFPTVGMLILMLIGGYTPFGDRSMLYSDMWHQYYPFFKEFRRALLSGDSLQFNWTIGMGIDYLGLISYYLASPLNWLCILVPDSWTLPLFGLLMPIKLGLAGLFFAIFLKKLFHKDDISLPLFGCFYAMCAWALGYQWNIMWLDTFALLPLVALGTVQLLKEKKFVLYTVTLFLSVFANYYVGFFTCIFVLLVFICYQICRCKSIKRLGLDFVRIGVFTVIAIGMTAVLSLPALSSLQQTYSSVNTYPEYFTLNMVDYEACKEAREAWSLYKQAKEAGDAGLFTLWWDAMKLSWDPVMDGMTQVAGNMNGGLEPTFKEGLPNLYCGVGTILFAFLFLTAKQVKLRDKICSVFLLVFFALSFVIRQLDYIWHGFHFTNQIPYRFSFLYSFVMLYMAYRAYLLRHRFRLWQVAIAGGLSIGTVLLSDKLEDPVYLAFNSIFFLLYFCIMLFARLEASKPQEKDRATFREYFRERKQRRAIANGALAAVLGLELILNLVNFGTAFPYTGISNYPKGTKNTASIIRYMKEDTDLFYRAEVTHSQTLNDGALNGYNGISTFTSSANVKVTEFLQHLGYAARNNYNRYCFEEASPVSNLFLNLKYMIERDGKVEENPYFDTKLNYGNVYLLENNAYLPLGFLAESKLGDLDFSGSGNNFQFQNRLFRTATGLQSNVWELLPNKCLSIQNNTTSVTTQNDGGYTAYKNGAKATYLHYIYRISDSGFLCFDMNMSARNSFKVYKNGKELYSESITLPQMFSVCQVEPGDEIKLEITCKANESGTVNVRPGLLNEAVFRQGYDILAASTLELTEFQNTYIEGTVNCNRDGLLYTSIPQDGNWTVKVDGQVVEPVLVGTTYEQDQDVQGGEIRIDGVMIGVPLTKGEHHITFTYRNKAFTWGLTVSLLCLLAFGGICAVVYKEQLKVLIGKAKVFIAKHRKK